MNVPGCYSLELALQLRRQAGEIRHIDGQEPTPRSLNYSISNMSGKSPQVSMPEPFWLPSSVWFCEKTAIPVNRSNSLSSTPSWNMDPDIGVQRIHWHKFSIPSTHLVKSTYRIEDQRRPHKGEMRVEHLATQAVQQMALPAPGCWSLISMTKTLSDCFQTTVLWQSLTWEVIQNNHKQLQWVRKIKLVDCFVFSFSFFFLGGWVILFPRRLWESQWELTQY